MRVAVPVAPEILCVDQIAVGAPFPVADAELAQPIFDHRRHADGSGDGSRRALGARQRGDVEGAHRHRARCSRKVRGGRSNLLFAARRERRIQRPVPTLLQVGLRFAVTN